jgi:5'-nucleotidase
MRILLTNDDGVQAAGLAALYRELSTEHEVWIFAPDGERSGVSNALTLRHPGKVLKLDQRTYSCSGTPADCVILARLGALPFEPEIVVSGINRGPNLGTDIIYSGTCGAARQAVLNGLPGIAVSCAAYKDPLYYHGAAHFIRKHVAELAALCDGSVFINVNAPNTDSENLVGEWTIPCLRTYRDRLSSFEGPDGYSYCFLAEGHIDTRDGQGTDHGAVEAGRVSVSAVLVHPQVAAGLAAGTIFG